METEKIDDGRMHIIERVAFQRIRLAGIKPYFVRVELDRTVGGSSAEPAWAATLTFFDDDRPQWKQQRIVRVIGDKETPAYEAAFDVARELIRDQPSWLIGNE